MSSSASAIPPARLARGWAATHARARALAPAGGKRGAPTPGGKGGGPRPWGRGGGRKACEYYQGRASARGGSRLSPSSGARLVRIGARDARRRRDRELSRECPAAAVAPFRPRG